MKQSFRTSTIGFFAGALLGVLCLAGISSVRAVESAEALTVCSDHIGYYKISSVSEERYENGARVNEGTMNLRLVKSLRGSPPASFSRQFFRFSFEASPHAGDSCFEFIAGAKRDLERTHYTAHPELCDIHIPSESSGADPGLSWRGSVWLERPHEVIPGGVVDYRGKVLTSYEEIEAAIQSAINLPVIHGDEVRAVKEDGYYPANAFWSLPMPTSYTDDKKLYVGYKRQQYTSIPRQYVLGASGVIHPLTLSNAWLLWALGSFLIWAITSFVCQRHKVRTGPWLWASCVLVILAVVPPVLASRPPSDATMKKLIVESLERIWSSHPASRRVRVKDITFSSQGDGKYRGQIIAFHVKDTANSYDPSDEANKLSGVKREDQCPLQITRHGKDIEWKTW